MTPEQQKAFDEVKAGVKEIEDLVAQSLNLQANGGYHVRNLAIALLTKVDALETKLNEVTEPAV